VSVHIIKLCVGVEDVDHLRHLQQARLRRDGGLVHITRNTPKRAEEILEGGSLYWVIKKFVRVRQRIIGIEKSVNSQGRPSCALVLDPALVKTELKEFRAFQGWRYFPPKDAPADLNPAVMAGQGKSSLPTDLAAELKSLGLI